MAVTALGGGSIDSNQDKVYNLGRQAGRDASIAVATYLTVEGTATYAATLIALSSTVGVGGACALVSGGTCAIPAAAALVIEGAVTLTGALEASWGAGSLVYMAGNPLFIDNESRNPKQDKLLSKDEIRRLQDEGIEIEQDKVSGGNGAGSYNLYKDTQGNVYIRPKGGIGKGEPLGVNIKKIMDR